MGKEIEPDKAQKLREGYFKNLNLDKNSKEAGCSIGTAHSHTKALEEEIAEKGLAPVLDKYGLREAKQVAVLHQLLKANDTSPEECFHVMPVARRFSDGHIDIDQMGTVVDEVFSKCPPELAQPLAASLIEFAKERAQNRNLSIADLRSEHQKITKSVDRLKSQKGTLTTEVQGLQNQRTGLQGQVNKLGADLAAYLKRLADAQQTDTYLKEAEDRDVIGVDIANVTRARQFFVEMERLGYSTIKVVGYLLNIPSLSEMARTLGEEVRNLLAKKNDSTKEIAELGVKRTEAEKATVEAQQRASDAGEDSDAKIIASQKRVDDRLEQEKVTLSEIEDTKKFRSELREAGLKVD